MFNKLQPLLNVRSLRQHISCVERFPRHVHVSQPCPHVFHLGSQVFSLLLFFLSGWEYAPRFDRTRFFGGRCYSSHLSVIIHTTTTSSSSLVQALATLPNVWPPLRLTTGSIPPPLASVASVRSPSALSRAPSFPLLSAASRPTVCYSATAARLIRASMYNE